MTDDDLAAALAEAINATKWWDKNGVEAISSWSIARAVLARRDLITPTRDLEALRESVNHLARIVDALAPGEEDDDRPYQVIAMKLRALTRQETA